MNGTTIEYRISPQMGVILNNVQTLEFLQEAVYDESNTDVLYQKFRITVEALCHTQSHVTGSDDAQVTLPPDAVGAPYAAQGIGTRNASGGMDVLLMQLSPTNAGATAQQRAVRQILMTKAGTFIMRFGGVGSGTNEAGKVILAAGPAGPATEAATDGLSPIPIDVANGPVPQSLKIASVANDHMLKIHWSIEINVTECPVGTKFTSGILSNRWSMQDTIDGNFYTTRRITGKARTRTALTNPHNFRGLVLPPLDDGFKRESMTFGATADGLFLE